MARTWVWERYVQEAHEFQSDPVDVIEWLVIPGYSMIDGDRWDPHAPRVVAIVVMPHGGVATALLKDLTRLEGDG